jgi:tetratricopeptide (TPR) repeat protein
MTAAVLVFSTTALPQSKKDVKKAAQLKADGGKSFNLKNYRDAIDKYAQAIVLTPDDAEAHFWKGRSHAILKENDQAISELNTALEKGYKKPLEIYKTRWLVNYDKQDYDAALADIKAGLALDPTNTMFLVGLGEISFARKNYAEALAAYQKVLAVDPNNADLYYNIAQVQYNLGDSQGQAEAAQEAVKRQTRFMPEAYFYLADGLRKQKRNKEAADAYLLALNGKPNIYEAYRNLADIYRSEGRFNDAIDISKRGLRAFPNDGNIYTDLSWYYSLADRNEDAIDAAKAGISILPKQSLAYTNLCRA